MVDRSIEELRKVDDKLSQPNLDLGMALFEASPDALIITNRCGTITYVNVQAAFLLDYTKEELIGQSIEILVMEADRTHHVALRSEYIKTPHPFPMDQRPPLQVRKRDGTPIKCVVGVIPVTIKDDPFFVTRVRRVNDG